MSVTIQINERGSLTLPKSLRRLLGFEKGGIVLADRSEDGVILRPAVVYPIEMYSDERIAEFDAEDAKLKKRLDKEARK